MKSTGMSEGVGRSSCGIVYILCEKRAIVAKISDFVSDSDNAVDYKRSGTEKLDVFV